MADITYAVFIDWDDDGSVLAGAPTSGETVTSRVLNVRTAQRFSYGRDTARSLSAVKPGQVTIELSNVSKDYSPDNASSPLFGNLGTGRPVLVRATHNAITYDLIYGFIDDYVIDPFREKKSVTLTVVDILGRLAATLVSTECHQSIQTGAAIEAVLDAAGWPADKRDIDPGSSTLRYWIADAIDAWSAIQEIIVCEGTPSIAYVDPATGSFVFRDRHHRKLYAASLTSQATFRDTGSEPLFSDPVEYNVGFRDLINSTDFTVEERAPLSLRAIWATDSTFVVPAGTTQTLKAVLSDPAFDVATPVVDTDYKLLSGTVTITLNRNSGKTIDINITATTTAYLTGMQLRGFPCPVVRNYKVQSTNGSSVTKYGAVHPTDSSYVPKWAGVNDAEAIGDIIVSQRGERLPVMTITVKSANDTRKVQILSRKLGDKVTIVEAETSTNHTHFIERIEHGISRAGKYHEVRFGCERQQSDNSNPFTFDVAGKGFDQGELGPGGFDDPASLFILDDATSGHRLDTGKLGT